MQNNYYPNNNNDDGGDYSYQNGLPNNLINNNNNNNFKNNQAFNANNNNNNGGGGGDYSYQNGLPNNLINNNNNDSEDDEIEEEVSVVTDDTETVSYSADDDMDVDQRQQQLPQPQQVNQFYINQNPIIHFQGARVPKVLQQQNNNNNHNRNNNNNNNIPPQILNNNADYNIQGVPRPQYVHRVLTIHDYQQAIQHMNIELKQYLAEGYQGCVFEGYDHSPEAKVRNVAVKFLLPPAEVDLQAHFKKCFFREIQTLVTFSGHKHVVPAVRFDIPAFCIVTKLMTHKTLHHCIHKIGVSWPKLLKMAIQVSDAMSLLHSFKYVHRDLRTENVFVDDNFDAYLADFGMAKQKIDDESTGFRGHRVWRAPELFFDEAKYTSACDVYSFGLILYEMATLKEPLEGFLSYQIETLKHKNFYGELPDYVPKQIQTLIQSCCDVDAKKRPTFATIYKQLTYYQTLMDTNYNWCTIS